MSKKNVIHPDFAKLPKEPVRLTHWNSIFFNTLMAILHRFRKPNAACTIEKRSINGLDGYQIPVQIIKPKKRMPHSPCLLSYHGGAFTITYSNHHLDYAERYAEKMGCCIIFVDYRLSHKYPFPNGFNDCYAALLWTIEHAAQLGINPQKIAVTGDSAGAAIAASVAQKAAQVDGIKLCGQLLIYPVTDKDCKTRSAMTFTDVPLFNASMNRKMWRLYLGGMAESEPPPYASPIHGSVAGVPPAYIEIAEFDPLRDEGENYAKLLEQNGIEVTLQELKGGTHGYEVVQGSELVQEMINGRFAFLNHIFNH